MDQRDHTPPHIHLLKADAEMIVLHPKRVPVLKAILKKIGGASSGCGGRLAIPRNFPRHNGCFVIKMVP